MDALDFKQIECLTEDDLLAVMRAWADKCGSHEKAGFHFGVSRSHFAAALSGRCGIPANVGKSLRLKPVTVYAKINESEDDV